MTTDNSKKLTLGEKWALEYRESIESMFRDKDSLITAMGENPYHDSYTMEDDECTIQLYIGSVLNLYPSGKYYTPWANSNVNPCPSCYGKGFNFRQWVQCPMCSGKGTRNLIDLALIFNQDVRTLVKRFIGNGSTVEFSKDGIFATCNQCDGNGMTHPTCNSCGGIGSREAYQDELFAEELDKFAESIGAYIESGEGDPLDLYLVKTITRICWDCPAYPNCEYAYLEDSDSDDSGIFDFPSDKEWDF